MATKIRLARGGKKRAPYYYITVADVRAPRDGKFIERIGNYNPNTNPATINLDFDRALTWIQSGAEPTDTVRAILSYKGVMFKNHLLKGVKKGALTEEQAEAKFQEWLNGKEGQIEGKKSELAKAADSAKAEALKAEAEINAKRAEAITAKNTPVEEAPAEEEVAEAPEAAAEEATEEAPAEENKEESAE